jgi:hypothetical protein
LFGQVEIWQPAAAVVCFPLAAGLASGYAGEAERRNLA